MSRRTERLDAAEGLPPPVAPAAMSLLGQARGGLAEARRQNDPVERFTAAYGAAVRAAAGVLAAHGRPHRGRAKPASVWSLLDGAAPELAHWAGYFAAHSAAYAAAQAGGGVRPSKAAADDLAWRVEQFVALAAGFIGRNQPGRDQSGRDQLGGDR